MIKQNPISDAVYFKSQFFPQYHISNFQAEYYAINPCMFSPTDMHHMHETHDRWPVLVS